MSATGLCALIRVTSLVIVTSMLVGCAFGYKGRSFSMKMVEGSPQWKAYGNTLSRPGVLTWFIVGNDGSGNEAYGRPFPITFCSAITDSSIRRITFRAEKTELHIARSREIARLRRAKPLFLYNAKLIQESDASLLPDEIIPSGWTRCFNLEFDIEAPSGNDKFELRVQGLAADGAPILVPAVLFTTMPGQFESCFFLGCLAGMH